MSSRLRSQRSVGSDSSLCRKRKAGSTASKYSHGACVCVRVCAGGVARHLSGSMRQRLPRRGQRRDVVSSFSIQCQRSHVTHPRTQLRSPHSLARCSCILYPVCSTRTPPPPYSHTRLASDGRDVEIRRSSADARERTTKQSILLLPR